MAPHAQLGSSNFIRLCFFLFLSPSLWIFRPGFTPSSAKLLIADGTPVKLQLAQTISSAHARSGDRLDFVVTEDVIAGGLTIIRAGTMASGSVIKVHGRRFLGLGGNVIIKLDSVELVTATGFGCMPAGDLRGSPTPS